MAAPETSDEQPVSAPDRWPSPGLIGAFNSLQEAAESAQVRAALEAVI